MRETCASGKYTSTRHAYRMLNALMNGSKKGLMTMMTGKLCGGEFQISRDQLPAKTVGRKPRGRHVSRWRHDCARPNYVFRTAGPTAMTQRAAQFKA